MKILPALFSFALLGAFPFVGETSERPGSPASQEVDKTNKDNKNQGNTNSDTKTPETLPSRTPSPDAKAQGEKRKLEEQENSSNKSPRVSSPETVPSNPSSPSGGSPAEEKDKDGYVFQKATPYEACTLEVLKVFNSCEQKNKSDLENTDNNADGYMQRGILKENLVRCERAREAGFDDCRKKFPE